jgi:hypothetical protein
VDDKPDVTTPDAPKATPGMGRLREIMMIAGYVGLFLILALRPFKAGGWWDLSFLIAAIVYFGWLAFWTRWKE